MAGIEMSNHVDENSQNELQQNNVKISDIQGQTKLTIEELFGVHENQEIMTKIDAIRQQTMSEKLSLKEEIDQQELTTATSNANAIKLLALNNQLSNYFA